MIPKEVNWGGECNVFEKGMEFKRKTYPTWNFKSILLVEFLYEVLGMYFQKVHTDCP